MYSYNYHSIKFGHRLSFIPQTGTVGVLDSYYNGSVVYVSTISLDPSASPSDSYANLTPWFPLPLVTPGDSRQSRTNTI